jgi:CRISPR-associated protein Cas1
MQLLNTLYVTQSESYLRLENDTLCVEIERKVRLRVPLHHWPASCVSDMSVCRHR